MQVMQSISFTVVLHMVACTCQCYTMLQCSLTVPCLILSLCIQAVMGMKARCIHVEGRVRVSAPGFLIPYILIRKKEG
jgi:hypothetical protein